MIVRKGIQAGLPFRMADWQKWTIRGIFERDPETGRFRYRRVLIGIARKNGKSLLGAAIALHGLISGGMGAEVYSVAGTKPQARLVFEEVKWQAEHSSWLRPMLKVYKDVIEHPESGSVYRALPSDPNAAQGLNPSLVLFDELHVQRTFDLWDAMTLGSGTRLDPIVVAITTAGQYLESPCGELYEHGKRVVAGEDDDPYFGFYWWEAPEGCDRLDEVAWRAANPNLAMGLLDIEDLRGSRSQRESAFRRFRLNQWWRGDDAWVTPEEWQACYGQEELDWERPFVAALDMALKRDTAALVVAQPYGVGEPEERGVETRMEGYQGEDSEDEPDPEDDAPADVVASGLIRRIDKIVVRAWFWKPKGGKQIDVFEIEETLRDLHALGMVACAYDPAYFNRSAQILADDGLNMIEFPQQSARMVPACGDAYEVIARAKVRHGGQPTLTDHVLNAVARSAGEAWRLSKNKSKRKIDGAVALVMSLHESLRLVEELDPAEQVW